MLCYVTSPTQVLKMKIRGKVGHMEAYETSQYNLIVI